MQIDHIALLKGKRLPYLSKAFRNTLNTVLNKKSMTESFDESGPRRQVLITVK